MGLILDWFATVIVAVGALHNLREATGEDGPADMGLAVLSVFFAVLVLLAVWR